MKHGSNKTLFLGVTLVITCLIPATTALAAIEGGDARRGRELTLAKCKSCHVAGASGGTMTPLSKTQRQWERFYVKDRHNRVAPGTWDKIEASELKDIMQYMHDHAADSPQPETCGK